MALDLVKIFNYCKLEGPKGLFLVEVRVRVKMMSTVQGARCKVQGAGWRCRVEVHGGGAGCRVQDTGADWMIVNVKGQSR